MLEASYKAHNYIPEWDVLKKILEAHVTSDKKIVFTNGCFDLIHSGHIYCLDEAKKQGDILVVALNTDESIKKIKGPTRPIKHLKERANVMAAIRFVDYVTCFSEDTPEKLIDYLFPTIKILVKGADYSGKKPAGSLSVEKAGGRIVIIGWKNENSTTTLVQKMSTLSE